ncbi:MAG: AAA family ATPase [Pseudomonadota bacterium]
MQLNSFRIKHFRSIIDTNWINLSLDNVTAVVGQNESGKTAILEALSKTFSDQSTQSDDLRFGDPLPEVWIKSTTNDEELDIALKGVEQESIKKIIKNAFKTERYAITWHFPTIADPTNIYSTDFEIYAPDLLELLNGKCDEIMGELFPQITQAGDTQNIPDDQPNNSDGKIAELNKIIESALSTVKENLFNLSPNFILFKEESGLLPNKIDITDAFELENTDGKQAALNYLSIANIDLKKLVQSETRDRTAILKRSNKNLTEEFLKFWTQTIGKVSTLQIECSILQYPTGHEKTGKPYLEFLITDSSAPLHPKQRSRGTCWFISFFLQLRASQVMQKNHIFLLDEPGANLHEKAQKDVLELIEKIRETSGVIYSTHSPHLISHEYIHRILAVERDPDHQENPTTVIGAHQLGAASTDTLSPILSTMGVSLSRQTAIKKCDNVILEELSAYYYLKAFWSLTKESQEANFLPATGTSNVTYFAQLFLGWGLDFIVVMDDEGSGRKIFNTLKRDMFLDSQDWASKRMYKIKDCHGIEDVFSKADYKKYVISDPKAVIKDANSSWAKVNKAAKAIHALKFLQAAQKNEFNLSDLDAATQAKITDLVNQIAKRLKDYADHP